MTHKKLTLALAAALFALPLTAFAQDEATEEVAVAEEEEESRFSWNAAATSDYVFRGVSQTDEEPALQLGADLNFETGIYVGVWASNVDFGEGSPDIELDTYIGWNTDIGESWNLDLMVNRYNYIGEDDDFGDGDYNEFIAVATWDEMIGFTYGYTNDVYGLGLHGHYAALSGTWTFAEAYGLDVSVGQNMFDRDTGIEDYLDYSVSVNRDFGPVNIALGYYGSDNSGEVNFGETAEDRVVLTFSIGG